MSRWVGRNPSWDGGPNGLISAVLQGSFSTYQDNLATAHGCVGNVYPHFSWVTMTETPTVNHQRRWNPRPWWGNGHSGKEFYFDAITIWKWHLQSRQPLSLAVRNELLSGQRLSLALQGEQNTHTVQANDFYREKRLCSVRPLQVVWNWQNYNHCIMMQY